MFIRHDDTEVRTTVPEGTQEGKGMFIQVLSSRLCRYGPISLFLFRDIDGLHLIALGDAHAGVEDHSFTLQKP
jgi:hypothetical protein